VIFTAGIFPLGTLNLEQFHGLGTVRDGASVAGAASGSPAKGGISF
jgi:hypothetical protein